MFKKCLKYFTVEVPPINYCFNVKLNPVYHHKYVYIFINYIAEGVLQYMHYADIVNVDPER